MKKILLLFLLFVFGVNSFACLIESRQIRDYLIQRLPYRPDIEEKDIDIIIDNIEDIQTVLVTNTQLSSEDINKITIGLIDKAPIKVLLDFNTMKNTTTAITDATNNASAIGFTNMAVGSISGSGSDGIAITMQQTNNNGGTYTVQLDTSSTTPQNTTTGTSASQQTNSVRNSTNAIYQPTSSVVTGTSVGYNNDGVPIISYSTTNISNNNNSVSNNAIDLTVGQATNGTSNTTGGSAIVGVQQTQTRYRLMNPNVRNTNVMNGVEINQNTTSTYSAQPTITTQSSVNFSLTNGAQRKITVASGAMQVVQKTITVIKRANGTIQRFETIGEPIVNMNLTTEKVKRLTVITFNTTTQQRKVQIFQGRQIEQWQPPEGMSIAGGGMRWVVDGKLLAWYNGNPPGLQNAWQYSSGQITEHTVYVMNDVPSVYQVQQGDQVGSTNDCTYYVNGIDTGVIAKMAIMNTVILASNNSTLSGSQITTRQIDGVVYYVVDGILTDSVYNQNDKITSIYRPIDDAAMNTKNTETITNVIVKDKNGNVLLNSDNLGQKVVQTIRFFKW